jgi:methionine synthase I (cobalamin-dependent)
MRLTDLLAQKPVLLADGATGTNLFEMGLMSGDPPEMWNLEHPDRILALHQSFVDAGADIILTNSFGGNRRRLALHKLDGRVGELNAAAARNARKVADGAGRLFAPLGPLTEDDAIAICVEQIEGLKEGGADVVWIETMSAVEEMRAAAKAAVKAGMPYTVTASFDTAGKTMMGIPPAAMPGVAGDIDPNPVAVGANCGVGASDLLVSILSMTEANPDAIVIAKANAGIPQFHGDHIHYSGTPELMAEYAHLAVDAGARIIGGCCGTSPAHLAAMRQAIDSHQRAARPDTAKVIAEIGPLVAPPKAAGGDEATRRRRRH